MARDECPARSPTTKAGTNNGLDIVAPSSAWCRRAKAGQADFVCRHPREGCHTERANTPEAAVAYDRKTFEGMIAAAGLTLRQFKAGSWRGSEGVSYQDVLILGGRILTASD